MEQVQLVLQIVEKLCTTVKTYYERGDIRQQNKEQLVALKQQYESVANILRRLENLSSPDFITLERMRLYQSFLQADMHSLTAWEQLIRNAKRTDRVKKMQSILSACETNVEKLFDFLSDRISPMLDVSAPHQEAYIPKNTSPPNPPRLILDYSTADTCEGQLKVAVLSKAEGRIVAVVASGKGGVGKTCALRGLAGDNEIKRMFPGGCLYLELGKDAAIATIVSAIANIVERTGGASLAKAITTEQSLQATANKAADWFSTHSCLFLVDDIWRVNGIDSSVLTILASMVNENSKLVYTTRDRHFLNGVDKVIEFLEKEQCGDLSRRMLKRHAGFSDDLMLEQKNKDAFEALLRLCQGLPLAFGVVGGSVLTISRRKELAERQDAWSDFHRDLCSEPKVLFTASALQYGPLSNIVDVSLRVVEKQNKHEDYSKRFRSFCVLQKQQSVPDHVLQKLWDLETLGDAQRVMSVFEEVSLVQVKREGDTLYVRLHDLILDLAIRKASENLESQTTFERLCRNYLPTSRRNDLRYEWWNVQDDGYIDDNLCRLVRRTGKVDELLWLLSKPQWIVKRFVEGGISSVEQDIGHGEDIAADSSCELSDRKEHLEAIRKAARRSCTIVANNPYEVWFQLHGRLLWHAKKCELTKRFVEAIEECAPRPWAKASLGLLQPAGAAVEMIPSPGEVRCISVETDKIWVLWVDDQDERFEMGVTCYKSATGTHSTQRFECDGIYDVDCCAFLRDGKSVATAHQGVAVVIWNRRTGQQTQMVHCKFKVRRRAMFCGCVFDDDGDENQFLGFSLDGSKVASASSSDDVQIWETWTGRAVTQPLVGHTDTVVCIAWSADGSRVVSGSWDGTVRVWDTRRGEAVTQPLVGHTDWVRCVAMSNDGSRVVSGSSDKTVLVWDAQSGATVMQPLIGHTDWVRCVAVSPDGRRIVSGSCDKTLRVWDAQSGEAVTQPLVGHSDEVRCVAVSADGRRIVSGSDDNTVRVWDAQNGEAVTQPLAGHTDRVLCAALSADGRRIATGSRSTTVRVWDAHTGEAVTRPLAGHTDWVLCVAVSADGQRIASGSRDGTVRVWDARSGEAVGNALVGHTDWVRCVAWSADGRRIVSGSNDTTVRVWDARRGEPAAPPLVGHTRAVGCVAMSADGRRIASGSRDGTARVWDAERGAAAGSALVHDDVVTRVAVDAQGRSVVSVCDGGGARLWDARRGACVLTARDAAWARTVGALALTWSGGGDRRKRGRYVRCGALLLATCDEAVRNLPHGDVYFSADFGRSCRIVRH